MARKAVKIYRENLAAALAEAKAGDGRLAELYQETANRVRLTIATRGETISAADLAAEIDEAFQSTLMRRVRTIKTSIEHAAKQGPKAARATFRATFEEGTAIKSYSVDTQAVKEALARLGDDYELRQIPIEDIAVRPVWQEAKMPAIRKGIRDRARLPPVRVEAGAHGKYDIADGIHRVNAARDAGLTHVPAIVPKSDVIASGATKAEMKTVLRTSRKALAEASERIAGRVTVDGVSLSKRVRKWDRELGGEMAREIQGGIRSKQGILSIAKKIEKLDDGYEAKLPQYLQEVEDLARQGKLKELKAITKAYGARARRTLGEMQANGTLKASKHSLRSATQKYLRDIAKAGPEGVDRVVKEYVTERAAYQGRLIARTESVNAFRRSYVEQSKSKPGVIGYRWMLSGRHPVEDECDILAGANQHGLGPGVFPVGKIPQHPHPNCLCTIVAVMDERHFERPASQRVGIPDDMRDTQSPDAVGWMINNAGKAERIVGPTRWAAFKQGINVLDHEGRPRLVRDILPEMARRQAAE